MAYRNGNHEIILKHPPGGGLETGERGRVIDFRPIQVALGSQPEQAEDSPPESELKTTVDSETSDWRIAQRVEVAKAEVQHAIDRATAGLAEFVQQELNGAVVPLEGAPSPVHAQGASEPWATPPVADGPAATLTSVEAPVSQSTAVGQQMPQLPSSPITAANETSPQSAMAAVELEEPREISGPPLDADEKVDQDIQPAGTVLNDATVRLNVEINGCVRQALRLVDELCQKPGIRLIRLVGKNSQGMDLWLGLHQPIDLENALLNMPGVSRVAELPADGPEEEHIHLQVSLSDSQ